MRYLLISNNIASYLEAVSQKQQGQALACISNGNALESFVVTLICNLFHVLMYIHGSRHDLDVCLLLIAYIIFIYENCMSLPSISNEIHFSVYKSNTGIFTGQICPFMVLLTFMNVSVCPRLNHIASFTHNFGKKTDKSEQIDKPINSSLYRLDRSLALWL
jgi:hypothetical protein